MDVNTRVGEGLFVACGESNHFLQVTVIFTVAETAPKSCKCRKLKEIGFHYNAPWCAFTCDLCAEL